MAPSTVSFGCRSCFLNMKLGIWRETHSLREGLPGLRQSWGLIPRVSSPFLACFPNSTCWLSARCWDTVTFSITQPSKGAGVYVPAPRRQAARELASPKHPLQLVGMQSQEFAAPCSAE